LAKNTIVGVVGVVGTVVPIAIGTISRTPIQMINISNPVIGRIYEQGHKSQIRHFSCNTTILPIVNVVDMSEIRE